MELTKAGSAMSSLNTSCVATVLSVGSSGGLGLTAAYAARACRGHTHTFG